MKAPRVEFEKGELVWCCPSDGGVFQGVLAKAGPVTFVFESLWAPRGKYRRGEIFKTELEARRVSVEPLHRELIRIAEELGDVRHRIAELEKAK